MLVCWKVLNVASDLDEGRQVIYGSPDSAQRHRGLLSSGTSIVLAIFKTQKK